jgi:hypothetical protein
LTITGSSSRRLKRFKTTYNAQSCRECHQNVVTGGASQVAELRSDTEKSQLLAFLESL